MIISGIVMASRPEDLAEMSRAVEAISWVDIHFSDPKGRLVVTIEAADLDQSMDRLMELQELPHVLMAELAQYCIEEEVEEDEAVQADAGDEALPLLPADRNSH